jgi:histidinol-phosphate aminotransferase
MERVTERLWIGSADDGRDVEALRAAGITAVLNATSTSDGWDQGTKDEIPYLRLGQPDGQAIPDATLREALRFLVHALVVEHRTVLVHCGAGISRAATFCIFWLMLAGLGWEEAERLVRAARPQIEPNPALKASVLAYFGQGAHA